MRMKKEGQERERESKSGGEQWKGSLMRKHEEAEQRQHKSAQ